MIDQIDDETAKKEGQPESSTAKDLGKGPIDIEKPGKSEELEDIQKPKEPQVTSAPSSRNKNIIHGLFVGIDGWKKEVISTMQSVVTILAILIGGIWFFISDQGSRKVNISHSEANYKLNEKWRWIELSIKIENAGKRIAYIESATIWLQKILPVPKDIQELIDKDKRIIPKGKREVQWNIIGRPYNEHLSVEILPGELDVLEFDFIIPESIQVVKAYSHFAKPNAPNIGWQHTSIIEFRDRRGEKQK